MKKSISQITRIVLFFLFISQLQACQLFKKVQVNNTKPPEISMDGEDQDFSKAKINIRIPINSKIVYVNGQEITLNSPPAYVDSNSSTMVPLAFISEIIGAKLEWIAETKEIIITQESKEIKVQINNYIALVNMKEEQLVSPPQIKDEKAFVPLKFIAQNLGFNSDWIAETKTIILTK